LNLKNIFPPNLNRGSRGNQQRPMKRPRSKGPLVLLKPEMTLRASTDAYDDDDCGEDCDSNHNNNSEGEEEEKGEEDINMLRSSYIHAQDSSTHWYKKYRAAKSKNRKLLDIVRKVHKTPLCIQCVKPVFSSIVATCHVCEMDLPCIEWCSESRIICDSNKHVERNEMIPNLCASCRLECSDCRGSFCPSCVKRCSQCTQLTCMECVEQYTAQRSNATMTRMLFSNIGGDSVIHGDNSNSQLFSQHGSIMSSSSLSPQKTNVEPPAFICKRCRIFTEI